MAKQTGILITNGDFYAQAALYLNEKGRQIKVFVPDNLQSFDPYFKGEISSVFDEKTNFIVLSVDSTSILSDFPQCKVLEKSFYIDSIDIVSVYKCN